MTEANSNTDSIAKAKYSIYRINEDFSRIPDLFNEGWKRVRHLPEGTEWHGAAIRDGLFGNVVSPATRHDSAAWTIDFGFKGQNQEYLFATGDQKWWMKMSRNQVMGALALNSAETGRSYGQREVLASSMSTTPYSVEMEGPKQDHASRPINPALSMIETWACATGAYADSPTGHKLQTPCVMYTGGWNSAITYPIKNLGMDVWVRNACWKQTVTALDASTIDLSGPKHFRHEF
jgi:hypothetical protein